MKKKKVALLVVTHLSHICDIRLAAQAVHDERLAGNPVTATTGIVEDYGKADSRQKRLAGNPVTAITGIVEDYGKTGSRRQRCFAGKALSVLHNSLRKDQELG